MKTPDPEYTAFVLNRLHQALAQLSWIITPAPTPREAAMREVLDHLVELVALLATEPESEGSNG